MRQAGTVNTYLALKLVRGHMHLSHTAMAKTSYYVVRFCGSKGIFLNWLLVVSGCYVYVSNLISLR